MTRILLIVSAVLLLGGQPLWAADFDHAAHLAKVSEADCVTCHGEQPELIQPPAKACLDCHDQAFVAQVKFPALQTHGPLWSFQHRPDAKAGATDCATCHAQDFCLECHKAGRADEMGELGNNMANVHRSEFNVTHPIAARTNPQLCTSCHENGFCVDCHEDFNQADLALDSHRRGFTDGTLGGNHALFTEQQCQGCHPNSVLPSHQWSSSHAREARKNLATCQSCHPEGDVCLKCHSARSGLMVNPHPKDWDDIDNRLKSASDARTCRKCH
ncbi:MAG: cytochrome C [Desulfuromonadales bacterium GWC2_61_20]|nr:MAG: cytochrome C [Desulfuromonadales bacterium GWC2_61_20]HAD04211.1 cytochrome C [Desulfuromonas sp.]